jgi:hypothetical protein
MHDLTRLREAQHNKDEARVLYTRALVVREQVHGAHPPETRETSNRLIALLLAPGQQEQATQLEMIQADQAVGEQDRKECLEE